MEDPEAVPEAVLKSPSKLTCVIRSVLERFQSCVSADLDSALTNFHDPRINTTSEWANAPLGAAFNGSDHY